MFASFNVKQEIGKDIYIHILVDNKYFRLIILYFCFIKLVSMMFFDVFPILFTEHINLDYFI